MQVLRVSRAVRLKDTRRAKIRFTSGIIAMPIVHAGVVVVVD